MSTPSYKVRLVGPKNQQFVFEASASVSEDRGANWGNYDIVQLPAEIAAYRNTGSRHFSLSGKLVSRTKEEAQQNLYYLDLIRSWVLPDFGGSGATPPFLKIYAYNNKNIDGKQVIIKSYNWSFPDEIDYRWIGEVGKSQCIPIIGGLTINVEEVYSAEQITKKQWLINMTPSTDVKSGPSNTFVGGVLGDSSSITFDFPSVDGNIVNALTKPGAIFSVGSMIERNTLSVPQQNLLNSFTSNIGKSVNNNPLIQEVTNASPAVKNVFVSGSGVLLNTFSKQSTLQPSPKTATVSDTFNRVSNTPPPIIES